MFGKRLFILLITLLPLQQAVSQRTVIDPTIPITAENVSRIQEITDLGAGTPGIPVWSSWSRNVALPTSTGIWIFYTETGSVFPISVQGYDAAWKDAQTLVVTDGTQVILWNTVSDEAERVLTTSLNGIDFMTISPDHRFLAVVGDNMLALLNLDVGVELIRLTLAPMVLGLGFPHVFAFSPDGSHLAYADPNAVIHVLNTATNEDDQQLTGHTGAITNLLYHPDGIHLATSSDDGTVRLWDAAEGRQVASIPAVALIGFSPDGRWVAVSGENNPNISGDEAVIVWDMEANQEYTQLAGSDPVSFSSDGTYISYTIVPETCSDTTTILYNLKMSRQEETFTGMRHCGYMGRLYEPRFYPNGFIYPQGIGLFLWTPEAGARLIADPVYDYAVSPDGYFVSTYALLPFIQSDVTWRVIVTDIGKDYNPPITFPGNDGWHSLVFSPDGKTLATGGGSRNVRQWDITSGELQIGDIGETRFGQEEYVVGLTYSPDGALLAGSLNYVSTGDSFLWEVSTGEVAAVISNQEPDRQYNVAAFHPNGQQVAFGSNLGDISIFPVPEAGMRNDDPLLPEVVLSRSTDLPLRADQISGLAYSPDGTLLVSSSWDGTVRLWDAATYSEQHMFQDQPDGVWAVAFSPDGQTLASGGEDGTVWLRETGADGSPARVFTTPELTAAEHHAFLDVKFSPDGSIVAAVNENRHIYLWNAATGELLKQLPFDFHSWQVAFSPDGTLLAAADDYNGTVRLWGIPA